MPPPEDAERLGDLRRPRPTCIRQGGRPVPDHSIRRLAGRGIAADRAEPRLHLRQRLDRGRTRPTPVGDEHHLVRVRPVRVQQALAHHERVHARVDVTVRRSVYARRSMIGVDARPSPPVLTRPVR